MQQNELQQLAGHITQADGRGGAMPGPMRAPSHVRPRAAAAAPTPGPPAAPGARTHAPYWLQKAARVVLQRPGP